MDEDFITNRIFQPLSLLIYNWVGISIPAFTLLALTVIVLVAVVLLAMKNA